MKIELSGDERSIIAVYLNSFEVSYRKDKKKHVANQFAKVKREFLKNSDKVDARRGDWSLILKILVQAKDLIEKNVSEVEKMEDEKERLETLESMAYAKGNILSALDKIKGAPQWMS